MKEREKCKKTSRHRPQCAIMVLEIFHFKVRNLGKMDIAILRFSASFSLKYDITDAILQDIEKIKVQYLMSLLFDLFEILQAVRSEQRNFA